MAANAQVTRSGKFSVGGHDWRIMCYPKGYDQAHEGYISFFLEHASHYMTGDATAKVEISILDESSKPTYSRTTSENCFTENRAWGWRDFIKQEVVDKEKHLKDDCLTILCDVTVAPQLRTENHVEVAAPEPTIVRPVAPPFNLRGQLAEAIWNKQQVDVKIKVGGETFPAHRWVLEARSPVFKADLSLIPTAAGTAELCVDDMDAAVFKTLLQFMYTDSPPLLEAAATAQRLLVAADRYELEKLKLICEEALCQHIDMSSVAATLEFAERHHCSVLTAACMRFLSSPGNLEAFMATDSFRQLKTAGCPSPLLELVENKMP